LQIAKENMCKKGKRPASNSKCCNCPITYVIENEVSCDGGGEERVVLTK